MITRDTVPCWYELSWRGDEGIVLRIHVDYANAVKLIPADAPIVEDYTKDFGFSKFSGEFGRNFGFEDSLPFLGEKDGFQEYSIPTPLVRKATGKCPHCEGSGKDDLNEGEKCLFCMGGGKNITYDYSEAYAISATLTTLFELMRFPEVETSCNLPQLMTIQTVTIRDQNGGAVAGEYSKEAVKWLTTADRDNIIQNMVSAMKAVWGKMEGEIQSFYEYSFRVSLGDSQAWLCTDCPGDACGLHPHHNAGHDIQRGNGYKFASHNVDTPQQQLVILASLAALHDLMRQG